MNCRKVSSSLSAYIDGELAGVEHRMIFDHLSLCETCSAEYEGLLNMKRMVSMLKIREPHETLPLTIISRIEEEQNLNISWLQYQFMTLREAVLRPASPSQISLGLSAAVVCIALLASINRPHEKIEWSALHTGGIASLDSSSQTLAQMESPLNLPLQFAQPAAFSGITYSETIPGFQPVIRPLQSRNNARNPMQQNLPNQLFPPNR